MRLSSLIILDDNPSAIHLFDPFRRFRPVHLFDPFFSLSCFSFQSAELEFRRYNKLTRVENHVLRLLNIK